MVLREIVIGGSLLGAGNYPAPLLSGNQTTTGTGGGASLTPSGGAPTVNKLRDRHPPKAVINRNMGGITWKKDLF
jgi:hypothetical protein